MSDLPIFSVAELTALTNQVLDTAFPRVLVEGELANFRLSKGKYVYFDIKDSEASINCFMMAYQLHTELADGQRVRLAAKPQLTPWGRFSLVVQAVELSGEGTIKKASEALHRRLEAEGLFAPERKRFLPLYPQHIAVVTSTESAAYHDFIKVAGHRWTGLTVEVANVQVQGMSAPEQLASAIAHCSTLSPLPEAIVIIRGGGSADDLQAFSSELVVRAVAQSRVPTVVGVGHEQDVSLAELAADIRASTPSNAAELLLPDKQAVLAQLGAQGKRLERAQAGFYEQQLSRLRQLAAVLERHSSLHLPRERLEQLTPRLESALRQYLRTYHERVASLQRLFVSYDPRMVLRRGYALVRAEEGRTVREARSLQVGQLVMVELAHGTIDAEVRHIHQT